MGCAAAGTPAGVRFITRHESRGGRSCVARPPATGRHPCRDGDFMRSLPPRHPRQEAGVLGGALGLDNGLAGAGDEEFQSVGFAGDPCAVFPFKGERRRKKQRAVGIPFSPGVGFRVPRPVSLASEGDQVALGDTVGRSASLTGCATIWLTTNFRHSTGRRVEDVV